MVRPVLIAPVLSEVERAEGMAVLLTLFWSYKVVIHKIIAFFEKFQFSN
jgi:hypothetical protein